MSVTDIRQKIVLKLDFLLICFEYLSEKFVWYFMIVKFGLGAAHVLSSPDNSQIAAPSPIVTPNIVSLFQKRS